MIDVEDTPSRLIRGGFVRQAHAGFFHLLPLGLRIQEKLEKLIDRHMTILGASKVSLSSISAPALWKRSSRYNDANPELFQLRDRKGARYLLSPTHEEEITTLVENVVTSYKQLPLLLYQISRKYRDEPRPRQGLLRTREFLMKDLYTFDATPQDAGETYNKAHIAYKNFFDELQIPYLVAKADSGAIGGDLSHEYHFPTMSGEDTILSCGSCSYAVNEELARKSASADLERPTADWTSYKSWFGLSKDRSHLVEAILPQDTEVCKGAPPQQKAPEVNPYLLRTLYPELDLGIEDPLRTFTEYWTAHQSLTTSQATDSAPIPQLTRIYDYRVSQASVDAGSFGNNENAVMQRVSEIVGSRRSISQTSIDLARFKDGDKCPECGHYSIKMQQAIELGHTFYLGDRYSKPLNATFTTPPSFQHVDVTAVAGGGGKQTQSAPTRKNQAYFQMGCHGIGISRMIAAVADSLADKQGLRWPRVMAPFEAAILATDENKGAAEEVWDLLARPADGWHPLDAVLDDREDKGLGWKLKDADLIGFPIVIVLGLRFSRQALCEVSIPRLGIALEKVSMDDLRHYIGSRLDKI
ncbi:MAG: hypothetical protein LQ349_001909 [Xanthoria aureola]|nr:MAG: hypothetical protein LQ349_001909 [Xanthoria aureola]